MMKFINSTKMILFAQKLHTLVTKKMFYIKIIFQNELVSNNPWLVYSKKLEGGLWKTYFLFDPVENNVNRGIFVKRAFTDISKPEKVWELAKTQYHHETIFRVQDLTSDLNFL